MIEVERIVIKGCHAMKSAWAIEREPDVRERRRERKLAESDNRYEAYKKYLRNVEKARRTERSEVRAQEDDEDDADDDEEEEKEEEELGQPTKRRKLSVDAEGQKADKN